MSTTPSTVTKGLLHVALAYYFTKRVDAENQPLYSPETVKIAEDWLEEQETSEEEEKRIKEENGQRMIDTISKALHRYGATLDESSGVVDEEYTSLREAQNWTAILKPGKDIF